MLKQAIYYPRLPTVSLCIQPANKASSFYADRKMLKMYQGRHCLTLLSVSSSVCLVDELRQNCNTNKNKSIVFGKLIHPASATLRAPFFDTALTSKF
jgi:hypothetical protein